jgi:hypothetical protein
MPLLAHSGHWLVNVMYVAPVLVIVVWVGVQSIRDRRSGGKEDQEVSS